MTVFGLSDSLPRYLLLDGDQQAKSAPVLTDGRLCHLFGTLGTGTAAPVNGVGGPLRHPCVVCALAN